VILQIDDTKVQEADDVVGAFLEARVGQTMTLVLWREGGRARR